MDLFSVLKNNQIFQGLNDEEVNEIASICHEKDFTNGSTIFEEGRQCIFFCRDRWIFR